MSRIVLGEGPSNAKIVFVGEAPGKHEAESGRPFVGPAGQTFDNLLRSAGLIREEVYVTNVAKVRPPGNRFRAKYYVKGKPTDELLHCYDQLKKEIETVNPNLIVPMGNEPLRALTGKDKITNWRGSILDSELGKVIPTFHPSAVNRNWGYYPLSLFDFYRIADQSKFPELDVPDPTINVARNITELEKFYTELTKLGHAGNLLSFDIETFNRTEIDCIGFCASPDWAVVVPLCHSDGSPYWSLQDEMQVWRMIASMLADPKIPKVAQNANFDITVLERYGCPTKGLYMDTMCAHSVVYAELPKGLDTLTSIYTKFPYFKDQSKVARWHYNGMDAIATHVVANELCKELKDFGVESFYFDFIHLLVNAYREMGNRGLKVDMKTRAEVDKTLSERMKELKEEWAQVTGKELNLNSSKQLLNYYYGELGYHEYKNRSTGRPTLNDEAAQRLYRKYNDKSLPILLEYRKLSKCLSTYVRSIVDPDERMRTEYKVFGTETGRLSSSKCFTGHGTNLQNLYRPDNDPSGGLIRAFYIPSTKGRVFIQADLSGADARVVGLVTGDPGLLDIFTDPNKDYHTISASLFFGIPVGQVSKAQRQIAKAGNHASNYDVSFKTLALTLAIPENEAKAILATYHNTYPMVRQWHREVQYTLKTNNRVLTTPMGRKRTFFGRWGDSLFKEAYAFIPQSTVGDVIHKGLLNLRRKLPSSCEVVQNVHDSLVIECPRSIVKDIGHMAKECMEFPITYKDRELIIPVDLEVGDNLKDKEDLEL